MPEPDPSAAVRTASGVTPVPGGLPGESPPFSVPDHTLIRRIGKGAYGEVWLARNTLGTWRAVKFVRRSSFDDDRPFEREFAGIQSFEPISRSHESQLNILHVGRAADGFYYVMELADDMRDALPGNAGFPTGEVQSGSTPTGKSALQPDTYTPRDLRSELHLRGRLPAAECLRLGLALTTALEHLHKHGLVHRDIKPSNIVFVNGIPKLADIGLVARAEATASFVGTEGFLPPEGPGTRQADIYSLGKVLYELSTGHDRQQFPELPTNIIELPDRAELSELNEVLLKACDRDPNERYQTAAEMHADLALLESGRSVVKLRGMERRLRFVQRAGAAAIAIAALAAGLYFWQARQTKLVRNLADQNRQIAADKTRLADENRRLAEHNRDQLIRLRVGHGIQALDGGDPYGALLWFSEALPLVEGDPVRSAKHRVRIQATLREQPRLLHVFDFSERVGAFNVSLDQRWIAAGSFNGLVGVWDVVSGEARGQPYQCFAPVGRSVFSADGNVVLVHTTDGRLRLWEPDPGTVRNDMLTNVVRFEVNRDRRRLMTVEKDESVQLRDVNTLKGIGPQIRETNNLVWAKLSFDGTRIATSTSDGLVRVWDPVTGILVAGPLVHSDSVHWMNFSPDNQRLATVIHRKLAGDEVQLWQLSDETRFGEPIQLGRNGDILLMKFSRDGTKLGAIVGGTQEVQIWSVATRHLLFAPLRYSGVILDFNFSPDGTKVVTSCNDGNVRVWSAETGERFIPPLQHSGLVLAADFSEDGERVFSASDDGTVKMWSLKAFLSRQVVTRSNGPLLTAVFAPSGRQIATGGDGWTTQMWDAGDGQRLGPAMPDPSQNAIGEIRFSPDGHKLVTCMGRKGGGNSWTSAQIWDIDSGTPVGPPLRHERVVNFATFSPDGRFVITASEDQTVRIWNATDGSPEGSPIVLQRSIFGADLSPDGTRLATAMQNGAFQVVDLRSRKVVLSPLQGSGDGVSVRFSPDGRRLASVGTDRMGRVWDAETGRLITPPLTHADQLQLVNWRPDGRAVVTAGAQLDARVWDAFTGKLMFAPLAHGVGPLRQTCFSPDGRFIATCGDDSCVRVWDAETGEAVTPKLRHGGSVQDVAFSPDSRRIVTASTDGTARIYELTPSPLPASVLSAYSRFQSGHILDESGAYRPIPGAELRALGRELRAQHPELFE